ncbi:MAG TPA: aldehyde dehydrogenase family protein, partial [Gammaproteobacteria bacterium]|nr:aldehyde dehydrogenase family protein [Gammaproteobacteria bacterium]
CSALHLLCLQEDTAERIVAMLEGCMRELAIGDPALLSTDVGPVIDADAHAMLADYVAGRAGRVRFQCELPAELARGLYFPPTLVELDRVRDLTREVFGPVLHIVRYAAGEELELVDEVNALGYGLTLGIHSRIKSFAAAIGAQARVGNVYVNRNMIGAQVEAQPFGGMGLSGTGPKAGGPHYLERFTVEQVVTTNTAAVGGNASLFGASA